MCTPGARATPTPLPTIPCPFPPLWDGVGLGCRHLLSTRVRAPLPVDWGGGLG